MHIYDVRRVLATGSILHTRLTDNTGVDKLISYYYAYDITARVLHPEEIRQHWLYAVEAAGPEKAHEVTIRVGDDKIPYRVDEDGQVWFPTNQGWICMGFYIAEDDSHHPIFVRFRKDKSVSFIRLRNRVIQTGVYYYDQHDADIFRRNQ